MGRNIQVLCNICNKQIRKDNMGGHLRSHNKKLEKHGGKSFECNKCNFTSSWMGSLKRHQKVKHADNNSLNSMPEAIKQLTKGHGCGMCDYSSSRKNDVIRHQRFKHLDIELNILSKLLKISNKRYKCGFCEYGNDKISMLKRHQELKH